MNSTTLLHRQIHPAWVHDGRVSSQAFSPTPKDSGLLSVYDGDAISAQDAWRRYTDKLNLKSVGVISVSVSECDEHQLPAYSAPVPDFPEHVVIDFNNYTKPQIRVISQALTHMARERGWQYRD